MKELIEKAKTSVHDLSDSDLAMVFIHLMEFPFEDFRTSDLIAELLKRETPESYEVLRALSIYYSELNGDYFYVGEGSDYEKAYLHAIDYLCRAYKARDDSFDMRLEKYGEFSDSHLERDLAFTFPSLLEYVYEIQEAIEYELGKSHELFERADVFIQLEQEVSELESPLDVVRNLKPNCESYVSFVRQSFEALPQDD